MSWRLTDREERAARGVLRALDPRIRLHTVVGQGNRLELPHSIVVVPASDEASRVRACLDGLVTTVFRASEPTAIVLVVNNTVDNTEQLALSFIEESALSAVVVRMDVPSSGGVGLARAAGFSLAASLWQSAAHYLTTDADSVVEEDWLACNLQWLRQCDAVCGHVLPAPSELARLPSSIKVPGTLEGQYWQLVMEIDSVLDPDPINPWPHHGRASGASLAFRSGAYTDIGGFGRIPCHEDTDLVQRLKDADYRVKYAEDVKVETSCRLDGRAPGGMADALLRRVQDLDSLADSLLEPAASHVLRIRARRQCRESLRSGQSLDALARFLDVDPVLLSSARRTDERSVWPRLELLSRRLGRRRLRPSELPREIEILERDLRDLKQSELRRTVVPTCLRDVRVSETNQSHDPHCPQPSDTRLTRQIGATITSPFLQPQESCHECKED